jgi:hypothetical protein
LPLAHKTHLRPRYPNTTFAALWRSTKASYSYETNWITLASPSVAWGSPNTDPVCTDIVYSTMSINNVYFVQFYGNNVEGQLSATCNGKSFTISCIINRQSKHQNRKSDTRDAEVGLVCSGGSSKGSAHR